MHQVFFRTIGVAVALVVAGCGAPPSDRSTPRALSDDEFWTLSAGLSEPAGVFEQPDNLVSNEAQFAQLAQLMRPERGGVYIGVGPEQNYSYIARLQPGLAFIVDIRQENRSLHLMYKALFEISADRADFVARLFSRERVAGVGRHSTVDDLFAALDRTTASAAVLEQNTELIRTHLLEARGIPLAPADLAAIDGALRAFFTDGPAIRYGRSLPASRTRPSYRVLMTATDLRGQPRSYLATEATFAFVKDLHARNLIVPVVGDFAGPRTIRAIGDYVRQHRLLVSAFYGSNVEVYLTRDQRRTFCDSLAALPRAEGTWFIASRRLQPLAEKLISCSQIDPSLHWP
jgi:hypothetical protein